jgi:glycosyltransferase involved in cell wall biosynthesis
MQTEHHRLPNIPTHAYSSLRGIAYWLKTTCCVIRIVLRANPDIIHANTFYAGMVSLLAAIVMRKKLILHSRDLANFGRFTKLYNRFCRKVIAVSHAVRNALVDQGVSSDKVEVIYNGVDKCSLDRSEGNRTLFIPQNTDESSPFVFAHVGQFVPWKNHIVFLRAASHVARDLPEARFVVVGDDTSGRDSAYKCSVLNYAANCVIAERVSFLGWQDKMCEVWPKINCLVHTADREPFGRVIVEAMAHRVPVIAVGTCGPSEIIQNNKTGILVQVDDVKGLSEAMVRIARHREFADALANAGYEHVMSSFTADKTAARIQEVYKEVLAM